MKKLYIIFGILISLYLLFNRIVIFNWVNPYTDTSGMNKIAKSVRIIDKGLRFAKSSSHKDGFDFNYIFQNAYGSGFLHNNPIPNDLDYAVGINLGEYTYDNSNAKEIAQSLVDKMDSFQYTFNFYMNQDSNIYTDVTQFEELSKIAIQHNRIVNSIASYLPIALTGNDYIIYTNKILEGHNVDIPYIMNANEILIENYDPIMLYSDIVSYNSRMPKYIRSISIIPEFFVTIDYKGGKTRVELVPESFVGERLQLSRRFFGSSTFPAFYSSKFLKNNKLIINDNEYFKYRMLSFKRHLQEVSNIQAMQESPVKMLKRIMQITDIISPLLDNQTKENVSKIVFDNLNNRDIQLINEYQNIITNIILIQNKPSLYLRMLHDGKIEEMYNVLISSVEELDTRNNIDKESLNILKIFAQKDMKKMLEINKPNEIVNFNKEILGKKYKYINKKANETVFQLLTNKEDLNKYIDLCNKIYTNSGYHRVFLYWLNNKTIGILKDDFTKNISDFNKFVKTNDLTNVKYKLVENSEVPEIAVKYAIWVRYNPTDKQEQNYQQMRQKLLDDRKNYKVKHKIVF